ncbi:MAG: NfeD family protein, partial [Vicinamibacterales bacterium]
MRRQHALRLTYLLAHLPSWCLAGLVGWFVAAQLDWPGWVVVLAVVGFVVSDLVAFPWMRRYYRSQPAARMVGKRGEAATLIVTSGMVRVGGELWQAIAYREPIHAGTPIRVLERQGLTLVVDQVRDEQVGSEESNPARRVRRHDHQHDADGDILGQR